MPKAKRKLTMDQPKALVDAVNDIAEREGVTLAEMLRRGLSILKAYDQQIDKGRPHLGFSADPGKLDAEMIGILTAPRHHCRTA